MKVLFICTGNTCRSPMAEAILQDKSDYQVKSAGIFAQPGTPTNEKAIAALKSKHIHFNGSSQPLTNTLVEWADLILTMTNQHKYTVVSQFTQAHGKIYTLKEYVSDDIDETWHALKQAHLNLEEKRSRVIEKHGGKLTEQEQGDFFQEELDEIHRLERKLPNLDIPDPFGLDQEAYQKTLTEISQAIDALIKKLTE
ncbi:low molecular weight protein arginine phosphatase [Amphibacillus sp. MSJ-3]|uniref:low molecular weight protein arginine phosphatase n=1 Tax=Amphibacillus sp. MSJ-3 TaxID=2841505 RepID=UPI001C0F1069|nr:low molecular weight protein arginine phosphatase [Amphibacillus sp. MSJ-3]MBU5594857.1 low molecular weight protein arginine phosphatase [Amphibacillus sp. MSJ-3]